MNKCLTTTCKALFLVQYRIARCVAFQRSLVYSFKVDSPLVSCFPDLQILQGSSDVQCLMWPYGDIVEILCRLYGLKVSSHRRVFVLFYLASDSVPESPLGSKICGHCRLFHEFLSIASVHWWHAHDCVYVCLLIYMVHRLSGRSVGERSVLLPDSVSLVCCATIVLSGQCHGNLPFKQQDSTSSFWLHKGRSHFSSLVL